MFDLTDFSRARVLVAGDVMLDRYWHGSSRRISPEAPVPVVRVEQEEYRPGGAANVALNIRLLGGRVRLLGLIGDDESGRVLAQRLQQAGVTCDLEPLLDYPTITKLRVVCRQQQLLRLDFENDFPAPASHGLTPLYQQQLTWAKVVVLSDYAKGTLADIRGWVRLAREAGTTVLVDPKRQDFSVYHGANLVTPNVTELEAVVGACPTEALLVERGMNLLTAHALGALLITRGEKGMTLLCPGEAPHHLPTHAREVYDVTGAGDTVIAVLAAALSAGAELKVATTLANHAAGLVVAKLGTAAITVTELAAALQGSQAEQRGVVTEALLFALRQQAHAQGERVVFTNGCFDILHAGHVRYLEQARRLGDRLVVAVNTDATVRALKGPARPVNCLERRMAVLAALACVDWVVPFHEATPERLICRLQPDVLVKGGDNDPQHIPGGDCVRAAGGSVQVLDYLEQCSTTGLIQRIRQP